MANNQKLEITGLDFDTIKDNLKTYMKNQQQFLDYDLITSSFSMASPGYPEHDQQSEVLGQLPDSEPIRRL